MMANYGNLDLRRGCFWERCSRIREDMSRRASLKNFPSHAPFRLILEESGSRCHVQGRDLICAMKSRCESQYPLHVVSPAFITAGPLLGET